MQKGNIIDLISYRGEEANAEEPPSAEEGEELITAIENLILRLRESKPLQN